MVPSLGSVKSEVTNRCITPVNTAFMSLFSQIVHFFLTPTVFTGYWIKNSTIIILQLELKLIATYKLLSSTSLYSPYWCISCLVSNWDHSALLRQKTLKKKPYYYCVQLRLPCANLLVHSGSSLQYFHIGSLSVTHHGLVKELSRSNFTKTLLY